MANPADGQQHGAPPPDHYATLGVRQGAADEELKEAKRRFVKELHPDVNPNQSEADHNRLAEMLKAYETLSVPSKKREWERKCREWDEYEANASAHDRFADWDEPEPQDSNRFADWDEPEPTEPPADTAVPDSDAAAEAWERRRLAEEQRERERERERRDTEPARRMARPATEAVRPARPTEVIVAVCLWIAVPVVDLLRTAILLGVVGNAISTVDISTVELVIVVVVIGAEITLPFGLLQGSNRARIGLTVLAALSVFGTFSGFSSTPLPMLALAPLIVRVAAVVMTFRPAANAWVRTGSSRS